MKKPAFRTSGGKENSSLSRRAIRLSRLAVVIAFFIAAPASAAVRENRDAVRETQSHVRQVIESSFPELKTKKIVVRAFASESDYFRARFSIGRTLSLRSMRYIVYVNPRVYETGAPPSGIRAIVAHELAHILYFAKRNRFELLGLVRLSSADFARDFERRADLTAIARGYGDGLIEYRKWLYQNIPAAKIAEKKKNYFSPEEIEIILRMLKDKPSVYEKWQKNVPRTKDELLSEFDTQNSEVIMNSLFL